MKVSYNWLQTYFSQPLPSANKLCDLFTFHAFEVEGVESVTDRGGKAIDTVLDLKVLPDRAHYALCHKGIAKEISVMTDVIFKDERLSKPDISSDRKPSIKIEADKFCRRYIGRYVEIPKIIPSSPSVEVLLNAIGQRSINSIVDATNYVMFDIGQPLHVFDADKVRGGIVVRASERGEVIELLDSGEGPGRKIELTEQDHVIADDIGPLAIAGVKGGKRAAITGETVRLILESANFEPGAVRRTSTRYDLRSESSKRYENEITPELALDGMDSLCVLIRDTIRDARFGPMVDVYQTKPRQTMIDIRPEYICKRLGVDIPTTVSKDILKKMGIIVSATGDTWKLTIPPDRLDLTLADDIVEEVGRIYGYEHIKGILPPRSKDDIRILPIYYLVEKVKNILCAHGYSEVSLYSLVAKGHIEAVKPLARDKAFARATLIDGMASCIEKNILNADIIGSHAIKIFEVGHIFSNDGESTILSVGAAQVKKVKGVDGKGIVAHTIAAIAEGIGLDHTKVNDSIIQRSNDGPVSICEIDLEKLLASYRLPKGASYDDLDFGPVSANIYRKISQYPFIVRDIAIFVPGSVEAPEVWSTIRRGIEDAGNGSIDLLTRHTLFDTFEKNGKVSYAFRMVFQSMERTLKDDEVNGILDSVNRAVGAKGWSVR